MEPGSPRPRELPAGLATTGRHSRLLLGALLLGACTAPGETNDRETATMKNIHGEQVRYSAGDVNLEGFLAYDADQKGERPGVLVVHEWWGHNEYTRQRARMLAEMGYTALAVDMYGDGKQATHPDDAQTFMMEVMGDLSAGKARFEAARKLLEDHATTDASRTAAIGYCFGGAVVLHMAREGLDLAGVASFHGSLTTNDRAEPGTVKARVLVLHGEDDSLVTPEQVKSFKGEMASAAVDMKFVAYPGAKHAFTNPVATEMGTKFTLPLAYHEGADKSSWTELEMFLTTVFAR